MRIKKFLRGLVFVVLWLAFVLGTYLGVFRRPDNFDYTYSWIADNLYDIVGVVIIVGTIHFIAWIIKDTFFDWLNNRRYMADHAQQKADNDAFDDEWKEQLKKWKEEEDEDRV